MWNFLSIKHDFFLYKISMIFQSVYVSAVHFINAHTLEMDSIISKEGRSQKSQRDNNRDLGIDRVILKIHLK